jgi:hypothetical protein
LKRLKKLFRLNGLLGLDGLLGLLLPLFPLKIPPIFPPPLVLISGVASLSSALMSGVLGVSPPLEKSMSPFGVRGSHAEEYWTCAGMELCGFAGDGGLLEKR